MLAAALHGRRPSVGCSDVSLFERMLLFSCHYQHWWTHHLTENDLPRNLGRTKHRLIKAANTLNRQLVLSNPT
jgi:hypothetical protein